LHSTSVGKALLAFLPPAEADALLQSIGLPRFTPRTIVSLARLKQELQKVRESDVAIDNEENTPGVRCVAAPIFGANGRVLAALSLTGPVQHVTEDRLGKIVEKVKEAARQLTQALGGHPPDFKLA
jgi:DNA-binding IclR family transcriptional regulator